MALSTGSTTTPRRSRLRLAAVLYFVPRVATAGLLVAAPLAYWGLGWTDWRIGAAAAGGLLGLFGVSWLAARAVRCPACSQPPLRNTRQAKHAYAVKWLGVSHVGKVAWDALTSDHHHCPYCHTRCLNKNTAGSGLSLSLQKTGLPPDQSPAVAGGLNLSPAGSGGGFGSPVAGMGSPSGRASIFDAALLGSEPPSPVPAGSPFAMAGLSALEPAGPPPRTPSSPPPLFPSGSPPPAAAVPDLFALPTSAPVAAAMTSPVPPSSAPVPLTPSALVSPASPAAPAPVSAPPRLPLNPGPFVAVNPPAALWPPAAGPQAFPAPAPAPAVTEALRALPAFPTPVKPEGMGPPASTAPPLPAKPADPASVPVLPLSQTLPPLAAAMPEEAGSADASTPSPLRLPAALDKTPFPLLRPLNSPTAVPAQNPAPVLPSSAQTVSVEPEAAASPAAAPVALESVLRILQQGRQSIDSAFLAMIGELQNALAVAPQAEASGSPQPEPAKARPEPAAPEAVIPPVEESVPSVMAALPVTAAITYTQPASVTTSVPSVETVPVAPLPPADVSAPGAAVPPASPELKGQSGAVQPPALTPFMAILAKTSPVSLPSALPPPLPVTGPVPVPQTMPVVSAMAPPPAVTAPMAALIPAEAPALPGFPGTSAAVDSSFLATGKNGAQPLPEEQQAITAPADFLPVVASEPPAAELPVTPAPPFQIPVPETAAPSAPVKVASLQPPGPAAPLPAVELAPLTPSAPVEPAPFWSPLLKPAAPAQETPPPALPEYPPLLPVKGAGPASRPVDSTAVPVAQDSPSTPVSPAPRRRALPVLNADLLAELAPTLEQAFSTGSTQPLAPPALPTAPFPGVLPVSSPLPANSAVPFPPAGSNPVPLPPPLPGTAAQNGGPAGPSNLFQAPHAPAAPSPFPLPGLTVPPGNSFQPAPPPPGPAFAPPAVSAEQHPLVSDLPPAPFSFLQPSAPSSWFPDEEGPAPESLESPPMWTRNRGRSPLS